MKPLPIAKAKAEELVNQLKPACDKIAIAGSVRRQKPIVKDIEIVCKPVLLTDLFGNPTDGLGTELNDILAELVEIGMLTPDGKDGPKYKRFLVQPLGIPLDLFITTPPAQYGVNLTIRTGPHSFSRKVVTQKRKGGLLPSYLNVKDGTVWNGKKSLEISTEQDFFNLLEIDWIEPNERE